MGIGAPAVVSGCTGSEPTTPASSKPAATTPRRPRGRLAIADWTHGRGEHYQIAHRGSGDVYVAGAQCIEVSVVDRSDGALVCMHGLTYDRTTTGRGWVAMQPSSVLADIDIPQRQLGPYRLQPPLPRVADRQGWREGP